MGWLRGAPVLHLSELKLLARGGITIPARGACLRFSMGGRFQTAAEFEAGGAALLEQLMARLKGDGSGLGPLVPCARGGQKYARTYGIFEATGNTGPSIKSSERLAAIAAVHPALGPMCAVLERKARRGNSSALLLLNIDSTEQGAPHRDDPAAEVRSQKGVPKSRDVKGAGRVLSRTATVLGIGPEAKGNRFIFVDPDGRDGTSYRGMTDEEFNTHLRAEIERGVLDTAALALDAFGPNAAFLHWGRGLCRSLWMRLTTAACLACMCCSKPRKLSWLEAAHPT